MTPTEFAMRYFKRLDSEFSADIDALVKRARAEARREALQEAERAVSETSNADLALGAIEALPRWDGKTTFKPVKP